IISVPISGYNTFTSRKEKQEGAEVLASRETQLLRDAPITMGHVRSVKMSSFVFPSMSGSQLMCDQ
ncbi:hypothetical protein X798_02054, partial [Onchocerca flexuosa]